MNVANCSEEGELLQEPMLFIWKKAPCKILEMILRHISGADTSLTFKKSFEHLGKNKGEKLLVTQLQDQYHCNTFMGSEKVFQPPPPPPPPFILHLTLLGQCMRTLRIYYHMKCKCSDLKMQRPECTSLYNTIL